MDIVESRRNGPQLSTRHDADDDDDDGPVPSMQGITSATYLLTYFPRTCRWNRCTVDQHTVYLARYIQSVYVL